jgi:hypothetical protein
MFESYYLDRLFQAAWRARARGQEFIGTYDDCLLWLGSLLEWHY